MLSIYISEYSPLCFCSLTGTQGEVFFPQVTQKQKQRLKEAIGQSGEIKIWLLFNVEGCSAPTDWGEGVVLEDGRETQEI